MVDKVLPLFDMTTKVFIYLFANIDIKLIIIYRKQEDCL